MHWLGIDIGTSAVKAVLLDEREQAVAADERPVATARPRPGWSEQEPEAWWQVVVSVMDGLAAQAPGALADVRAIGLSGQMHGVVLLGADDKPLRPAILWNDARAAAEAEALGRDHPELARVVGVIPMAGFTAPKLPWLRAHEPAIFRAIRTVMLPKDYVRLRLTGERFSEMSDAAGTWWLDEARRRWCEPALAACGLGPEQVPPLLEGSDNAGLLRPDLARRWGMRADVVVAAGAGDAAAGAVGAGAVHDGDAFVSLGTSAQLFVTTAEYRPAPDTLVHAFAHALPGLWYQMGAMLNGASALGFAAGLLGRDIDALVAEAGAIPPGSSSLLALPYLTGERTPHNDPAARGVIFGLTPATTPAEVALAVMEGVAFSIRDAQEALAASGTKVARAGFSGGGARSLLWTRILASVLGAPLVRARGAVAGPALGAARLARLALTHEAPSDVCGAPDMLDETPPDPALQDLYASRYERFRRLYAALKPEFARAAQGH
ncbi:MAG: xylulokinase [Alsobacter sp.]